MVTDAIIGILTDLLLTVLDLLPVLTLPGWASSATSGVGSIMGIASSMGAWIPLTLTVTVAIAVLAAYGIAFGIKLARIVASFLTAGGGSAA